ncbi:hypothetical protein AB5I39_15105 [Sphingomonas sp. MMS24-J45]|uniref:hypothetical protein n=1 Tax=Sphingomonas sp. MMS24-J45 TaxID=3238806 RepID=UPI00384C4DB7
MRPLRRDALALALVPLGLVLGGALAWPLAGLVALRSGVRGELRSMLLWYGVALGFDPQALLIGPFIAALAIQRHATPLWVALAGLAAAAILLARGFVGDLSMPPFLLDLPLSGGAPNLWVLLQAMPGMGEVPLIGLALVVSVGAAGAYTAWFSARRLYPHMMADAILLCALAMTAVMPATDATALMIADVIAVTLALTNGADPARWRIAGLVLGGSALALLPQPGAPPLAAIALLIATLLQARAVLKPAANDNPLMPRTA